MNRLLLLGFAALVLTLSACGNGHNRVNGSVSVKSGEPAQDVSTVNGSIEIEANGIAQEVETVNGGIELGSGAKTRSLDTVNGGVSLGENAQVEGDVETVNGGITLAKAARVTGSIDSVNSGISLAPGAEVQGRVENVNGAIRLEQAHVGGGIGTVGGDIEVGAQSRVEGGIQVKKSRGVNVGKKKVPRVVVGPGAVVQGPLKFEREVKLYVSETATIGPVEGATAVKFSGDRAPD